jgi:hypothetical protein
MYVESNYSRHAGEVRFDTDAVGPDGAGYRWEVRDVAHRRYSVAPPSPAEAPEDEDGSSDDQGSTTTAAELVRRMKSSGQMDTSFQRASTLELHSLLMLSTSITILCFDFLNSTLSCICVRSVALSTSRASLPSLAIRLVMLMLQESTCAPDDAPSL